MIRIVHWDRFGQSRPGKRYLRAEVRAHALCRMTRDQIADERRRPGTRRRAGCRSTLAAAKSEDQTIAALAAVHATLRRMGQSDPRAWNAGESGRLPVPRPVRPRVGDRFRSEGVWGVSPHLIPHYALHSPAGTLSLALGIHGPNLGVGGGDPPLRGDLDGIDVVGWDWFPASGWSSAAGRRNSFRTARESRVRTASVRPWQWAWSSELRQARSAMLSARRWRSSGISPAAGLTVLAGLLDQSSRDARQRVQDHFGLVVHDGHTTRGFHTTLRPANSGAIRPRMIAGDASGRLRVELLSPKFPHVKEVG